jgi:hypothetical protein
MTDPVATHPDSVSFDAVRVGTSCAGEMMSRSLHLAYDNRLEHPDMFTLLLDRLDQID